MREWIRQKSPIKESSLKPGSAGAVIMAKSRDNLCKLDDQDQWLSLLKQDLLSAVEAGRDVSDLITKVEAALYRSGSRGSRGAVSQRDSDVVKSPVQTATQPPKRTHPSALEVIFDANRGRQVSAAHTKKRLVRYQINPRANWGPLNRAGR
jgi:tRNA (guanine26-N2/guanine27-N2)-dimethyltransferase